MPFDAIVVLVLLAAVLVLFATERLPVDIITLAALCVLVATGILTPAQAFAGFSSDIIVILGAIFVLGGTLQHTGVLSRAADAMLASSAGSPRRLTTTVMLAAASLSAFMNNTTVAAIMVPTVSSIARRAKVSASKLLMPLAFATMLGGTCTLIGTSTNIAVSGYLSSHGFAPVRLFELLPVGLALVAAGLLYTILVAARLLPAHTDDTVTEPADLRRYFAEVTVLPNSPLVGSPAFDWELSLVGFRLVHIVRDASTIIPDPDTTIAAGDTLTVEGKVENLRKITTIEGLHFKAAVDPNTHHDPSSDLAITEAIVLPGSELNGATLSELAFRQRYGITALAVHRAATPIFENLADLRLREGDVLLLHGPSDRVAALRDTTSLLQPLSDDSPATPTATPRRGWAAVAIFAAAILTASLGVLPISIAFLAAAILVILTGCIPAEKAREFIDWRLLILIGGMTAFGTAMETTGAASTIAAWVVATLAPFGTLTVLAGFLVLTVLLTQPMSNAAAALVVLPVAMGAATQLGVDPRSFAIAVMLTASISFITPLEPACLLVYGPGKYRMVDFIKVGGLLTLVLTAIILVLVPILWPL